MCFFHSKVSKLCQECSQKLNYVFHLLLSLIYHLSLVSFLTTGKKSPIIPISKHSSATSSPTGYHPISLLLFISKVLERYIFNWLLDFCQTHNLLSDSQYGFRPGYSTESALITSTKDLNSARQLKQNISYLL